VGLKTAVAPQGTSITEGQLALMRRYHPQVECFFDSDSAGQKAALRFLPLALKTGLEVRFLMLAGAEKLDPDLLFLERGLPAYEEVKKSSLSAMEFAVRSVLPNATAAGAEQKARASQTLFEIVAQTDSEVARAAFIQELAQFLGVAPGAMERDLRTYLSRHSRPRAPAGGAPVALAPPSANAYAQGYEEHLLYLCLHDEAVLKQLSHHLPHEWIDSTTTAGRLLDRLLAEALHGGWNGRESLEQIVEQQDEKILVATLLFDAPNLENMEKITNEGLRSMQRRFLEPRQRQIELEIASKGTIGDPSLISLLKQRAEISRQLQNPPKLTLEP
jgi:DNA primase